MPCMKYYIALLLFMSVPAHATESLSVSVTLRGLNLESPTDYAEAVRRIRSAALRMCNQFGSSSRVDDRQTRADCVQAAVDVAIARLPPPVVTRR